MVSFYKPANKTARAKKTTSAPKTVQKPIELTIDSVDAHGKGIAKGHNPFVFVEGALPGEEIVAIVSDKKKHVWQARATKVERAHEQRRQPFCQHANTCGGCQLQHVSQTYGIAMRQESLDNDWRRLFKFDALLWQPAITDKGLGYRRKARLAIDARDIDNIKLGYKSAQTNKVTAIAECQVLEPRLQQLVPRLQGLLSELDGVQKLGHISLFAGDEVTQCTFRAVKPLKNSDNKTLAEFGQRYNTNVVVETHQGNFEFIHLEAMLDCETIDGLKLYPKPNHFVQVNGVVNTKMIQQAMSWLNPVPSDRVCDLFCGLGNFSLSIAKTGASVIAAEGVDSMVQDAKSNALKQGIEGIDWRHLDLNQQDAVAQCFESGIDKVLLDPSREGALTVCEALAEQPVEKVLYVSCNPTTFARDAKVLVEAGYGIDKVGLIEMFPFTRHLEVMALFSNSSASGM